MLISSFLKEKIQSIVPPEAKGIDFQVSVQENPQFGEYSTNAALVLAKVLKKKPQEIGAELIKKLGADTSLRVYIEKTEFAGAGFLNFYLRDETFIQSLRDIMKQGEKFGTSDEGAGKTIVIEHTSPNTNKPLHLGHLRNNFIGMMLVRLLTAKGYRVLSTEIVNDRGIHICKSMLAYLKWGNGETPESTGKKSDHFVGDYYVRYSQEEKKYPEIEAEARELLRKWESNDLEVRALWKKMNTWAQEGYRVTYDRIGSRFDFRTYESDIYDKGKKIILDAYAAGKVESVEGGALAVDLSAEGLGRREDRKKILVRSDGTTMYITQDIYLALKRWEEYAPEKVLYVVADEQIYHFNVLFALLKHLGFEWVQNRYLHILYGMVRLPEGKMKSREGTVVDADDLIAEVETLAREEILKRNSTLSESEIKKRAEAVALAALKFFILKVDHESTMVYNPKESLDFEGNTGPYIQYTYARLASIVRKNTEPFKELSHSPPLAELERSVVRQLVFFPEVVDRSAKEYRPHFLAEYVFETAQAVNTWYHTAPVLKEPDPILRHVRLQFIQAAQQVLANAMRLLGIPILEEL